MKILQRIVILLAIAFLCISCKSAPGLGYNPWKVVPLPTEATLQDIAFTGDSNHGWMVGSNLTLLETTDGGETWQERGIELDGLNYRFTSVSFSGDEGWIVGAPAILLHTNDGGTSWSRIQLSSRLPGDPNRILALGPQSAEISTTVGAIYQTNDGGKTWKALVQEAVGVVRNISRSLSGEYVAVSSNGSFYSTWEPGQTAWVQHNRTSSKRLQSMGFTQNGGLWLLGRGGVIQFTDGEDLESWQDPLYPDRRTNLGLLDLAYRTPEEVWIAGGSGSLLCSLDGGNTWQKDMEAENIPANLYKIVFLTPEKGFILGNNGVLLKYDQSATAG
ncbi:MAG TPA: photosystem II assembly protein [Cyanobacteria bacterium UBA11149]|nr:photosystem II assembly protein [Cyanobacteria bacterium UBA11367]HBE58091.1 photosystem II assembly protein [Cyanobacteria bacterium UBA11366]HBR74662.1 photosystem II assembly protein [Cyanobacteria bacterium UBA11159]HBS69982.1 photosystem II assembly protein [Cyanobacteria bacterium UBA11153]HBW87390.1 photosystem II assembly protein [Cyanobacteria bacterium UBA11149]HCA94662.1 photosystem II assembly protein [Cyanobacteria bacterium UBA9226]